jgi:fucose permease
MSESFKLLKNPYALGFSIAAFLYVAEESAIYVWMPSYLLCGETDLFACYQTELTKTIAIYSVSIFFAFRALGRFVGIWMMQHFNWSLVMTLFSFAIAVCFLLGIIGGKQVALYTFPLTGIFMSVLYPTINSKGISCFVKAEHGKVAGVILFFTALGAAAGPLVMGIVIDANQGDITTGFMVALIFTGLLFIGSLLNLILSPTEQRLREIEAKQYKVSHEQQ